MSEWREATLGEVAHIQQGKRVEHSPVGVDPAPVYGANGVIGSWVAGTYDHPVVGLGCRGSVGSVHAIPEGSWLGNNVMGIWPNDEEAVTAGFLRLFLEVTDLRSAGAITGQVQLQITRTSLAPVRLSLPPLDEQRRIVDVVAAVDAQIEALEVERRTLERALVETLAAQFEAGSGPDRAIDSLCELVIGGIWGDPVGEAELDLLALGPRIYTPGTSDFVTAGSPYRSFSRSRAEKRIVRCDDIILERSGGSPEQPVGRVVIAGEGLEDCVPTDFQRLLRTNRAKVDPRYLFWRLRYDWNNGLTLQFSRRTTGITNLSVKDYLARLIPVPDRSAQAHVVEIADAIDARLANATAELRDLRAFRSTLLTALLSQAVSVPESYDELLDFPAADLDAELTGVIA